MAAIALVRPSRARSRASAQMAELDCRRGRGGKSFRRAAEEALRRTQRRLDLRPKRPGGAGKRPTSHRIRRSRFEPPPRPIVAGGERSERIKRPNRAPMPLGLCATGLGRSSARKRHLGGLGEGERAGSSLCLASSGARPISGGLRRDGPARKNEVGGGRRDLGGTDLPGLTGGGPT